jgi:hypothetical protein
MLGCETERHVRVGMYSERDMPDYSTRNFVERGFTIGIGGYVVGFDGLVLGADSLQSGR